MICHVIIVRGIQSLSRKEFDRSGIVSRMQFLLALNINDMSTSSRRAAGLLFRASSSRISLRSFASQPSVSPLPPTQLPTATQPAEPDTSIASKIIKGASNNDPLPVPPTVYPAPADPWDVSPVTQRTRPPPRHSALRIKLAEFGAKVLGYNSRASTSIRETGRMMHGIVAAVERDSDYWYRGKLRVGSRYTGCGKGRIDY